jgi:hypothetical protein
MLRPPTQDRPQIGAGVEQGQKSEGFYRGTGTHQALRRYFEVVLGDNAAGIDIERYGGA